VLLSEIEATHIHPPGIPKCIFGQSVWMGFDLVCPQVHIRVKHNKFLFQTLAVGTHVMVFPEVLFQRVVVDKVLLLPAFIAAIANMAPLVLVSTMSEELVVAVES
jgi:hypothetical protein